MRAHPAELGGKNLTATGTAADSTKWGGYSIQVVNALPASPAAKTIYFVRKG